jgi:carbon monoxide dehydrogenase subunit G
MVTAGLLLPFSIRLMPTLALALLLAGRANAGAETLIRSIDIVQDADAYVANAVMFAPVPASIAWEVLTDFDHMAAWVPNVRESKVIAREADTVTVEQQGVAKFGLVTLPYTSVRQLQLDAQRTVRSTQIKGSMRRFESLMTLTPDGKGTQLNYHLEMVPAGLAAAALSKDFLKHELTEQFSAIIEEMARRSR